MNGNIAESSFASDVVFFVVRLFNPTVLYYHSLFNFYQFFVSVYISTWIKWNKCFAYAEFKLYAIEEQVKSYSESEQNWSERHQQLQQKQNQERKKKKQLTQADGDDNSLFA